jgi:hypothetical protein
MDIVMEDNENIDDLLGFTPKANKRGRPPKDETVVRQRKAAQVLQQLQDSRRKDDYEPAPANVKALTPADVQHGVTVGWLATVFGMDPVNVRRKLRDCAPIMKRKAGHVYDLKAAAQYLVKPVFDVEQYLKGMKPSELPTHLQDAYWSAMRKRQQWEADAGMLWRTEAVVEVLGDVFQTIKFAMQLWPDTVERSMGLTPEQRAMMISMSDSLQAEIHKKLIEMPRLKQTPSTLSEAPMIEAAKTEEDEDDAYASSLV